MESKRLTHHLLWLNNFDVAEGKHRLYKRLRKTRTTSKRPGTWSPSDKRVSKIRKMRSVYGQTRFCPMPVVAPVTLGTYNVRISDASLRYLHVEYKTAIKFVKFDSETDLWLTPQTIKKLKMFYKSDIFFYM